jgi:predicted nucleic-acid-binding Zn-ribbon protein
MEFPDDVLALIREFSRPLKRRIISNYWVGQGLDGIDEMVDQVFEVFKKEFWDYAVMCNHHCEYSEWYIYRDDDLDEIKVYFTETQLLEWNGEFKVGFFEEDIMSLERDTIMYKQLLQDWQVVKEKII